VKGIKNKKSGIYSIKWGIFELRKTKYWHLLESFIKRNIFTTIEIIEEYQSFPSFSKQMNTIPYEVLTSISPRVHRVYVEE
jgi:hypothetical protein